ncbi:calcium homeostasis modulator protein 3-like [Plectropomus leopardus]|uniref:calcium homeostasis modulator protein 3-like n=1 Tax=Plectropomus leopardus TaxID=160734 RepID=UPI001C4D7E04|nr:calcium homeostasis modulator protein 3-like [Plectropomus leopardus]
MAEQDMATAAKNVWTSKLKSVFKESHVVSDMFFGFIIFCLEKFIEKEFTCPCKVPWNCLLATAYFFSPAVAVFLLLMKIKDFQVNMDSKERYKILLSSFFLAILWILIVFWDGRSFACARTSWSGSYVEIDKAAPQKWCKPANLTPSQESDYINKTQHFFSLSQGIGMGLFIVLILGSVVYFFSHDVKGKGEAPEPTIKQDMELVDILPQVASPERVKKECAKKGRATI